MGAMAQEIVHPPINLPLEDDDPVQTLRLDRARFFVHCQKIDGWGRASEDAKALGLVTDEDVTDTVEQVLRDADLLAETDASTDGLLVPHVHGTSDGAYVVWMRFFKRGNYNQASHTVEWAKTWEWLYPLNNPGETRDILDEVRVRSQGFLDSHYARVNTDDACGGTVPPIVVNTDCYLSSVTSPTPLMGQTGEVITLLDETRWEVGIGEYHYLFSYYPQVIACESEGRMWIRDEPLIGEATELRVTKL